MLPKCSTGHAYRLDASFLKAYYHFELWKRYGDIAIADKLLTESEALALERTPGQEVVEYIVRALDSLAPMYDALETMKNTQYTNGKWIDNQYGRITKGAVLALKARVLLYAASPLNSPSGQYDVELCDRAARAAADVINLALYRRISLIAICSSTVRAAIPRIFWTIVPISATSITWSRGIIPKAVPTST